MQVQGSIFFRPNVSIRKGLGCSFSCDETMGCYIVHVIGFEASDRNTCPHTKLSQLFAESSGRTDSAFGPSLFLAFSVPFS